MDSNLTSILIESKSDFISQPVVTDHTVAAMQSRSVGLTQRHKGTEKISSYTSHSSVSLCESFVGVKDSRFVGASHFHTDGADTSDKSQLTVGNRVEMLLKTGGRDRDHLSLTL